MPIVQVRGKKTTLTRLKKINKVILADGHPLFRRGLMTLLGAEADLEVVAEVASLNEATAVAKLLSPDALVIDIDLLADCDEQTSVVLRQIATATGILFLTDQDSPERLQKAVEAGARGYMLKSSTPPQLIMGIRQIAQSEQSPQGLSLLTPDLKALASSNTYPRPSVLTLREQEVMRLLAEGRTVREVATELSLSIKTIEAHKLNLMRKLDIHNRTSLIEWAVRMGLLVPQAETVNQ
jgi:DNA-binding NarL/FixJ family response regulator